jgi:hypothetical protein
LISVKTDNVLCRISLDFMDGHLSILCTHTLIHSCYKLSDWLVFLSIPSTNYATICKSSSGGILEKEQPATYWQVFPIHEVKCLCERTDMTEGLAMSQPLDVKMVLNVTLSVIGWFESLSQWPSSLYPGTELTKITIS